MINLLPEDEQKQLRAGRSNTLLLRYNVALFVVAVVLIGAMGFTYYYLSTTQTGYEATIATNTSKEKDFTKVKTDAATFRSELANAKQLFDSQISYSKAVLAIAKLMPTGTVLSSIKLDPTSFSTPFILSAKVKGETEALKLKENFQNSSDFTNVTFGKINKADGNYPYTIELNVSMKPESAQ
ncbi:MAG: hypothetical protein ABJA64_01755 [Candidatus Saccharibacteria bacterium]